MITSKPPLISKTKVCIIGSGIGGGTLAAKLYELDIDFICIEAGLENYVSDNVSCDMSGRAFGLRSTRSIQLGGTSNLWHGLLAPFDEVDFNRLDSRGEKVWPISYLELQPFYKEAFNFLGGTHFEHFNEDPKNNTFGNYFDDLNLNKDRYSNKLFQQPEPVKSFKKILKDICSESNLFHCYCDSTALELKTNDNFIKCLKFANRERICEVHAMVYVISAGALETPRLLMNSSLGGAAVGKNLMDHPMANLLQFKLDKPRKAPLYSDIKLKNKQKVKTGLRLLNDNVLNHNIFFRPSFSEGIDDKTEKTKLSLLTLKDGGLKWKDVAYFLLNINLIRQIIQYKLSLKVKYKLIDVFCVAEQSPSIDSYVCLSDEIDKWGYRIARINWNVSDADINDIQNLYTQLISDIKSNGYTTSYDNESFFWKKRMTSAAHHLGTARMGKESAVSVVDKNLQVHDIANCFVCDGSVLPSSGNANLGLTISALAIRLAQFLKKNW